MKKLMNKMSNFLREEDGATAPEYGLIAALIAVVIIVAVTATGTAVSDVFDQISAGMTGV